MLEPTSLASGVRRRSVSPWFSYVTYVGSRQVGGVGGRLDGSRLVRALWAVGPVLVGVAVLVGVGLIWSLASFALPRHGWPQPLWVTVPVQLAGLPAVFGGVALWLRQRGNFTGPLLLTFGVVFYLGDLQEVTKIEFLFATGYSLYFLNLPVFTHLALLVPHGCLRRAERATLALLYLAAPGTQILSYLQVRPRLVTPQSLRDLDNYPTSTWGHVGTYVGLPLTVILVMCVIGNFRRSTVIQRRAYAAFWLGAAATGVAAVGAFVAESFPSEVAKQVALVVYALGVAGSASGLALGPVRLTAYSRDEFSGAWDDPDNLEPSVAAALGDPGLRLYWRTDGTWVDSTNSPHAAPAVPVGYARTIISVRNSGSALLVHDQVLAYHHALLRAVAVLTVGALERRQYHTDRTLAFIDGQDTERRRIRHELHDCAQGPLTGLRRNMRSLAEHLSPDDSRSREELSQMIDHVSETIGQLSAIVDHLYPEGVDSSGLASAMSRYVRRLGITVDLDIPYQRWPNRVERTAFYVISEALTNVIKHAQVDQATVQVFEAQNVLNVHVCDKGVGFTPAPTGETLLTSLRARVAALDGVLTIEGGPGTGTRLHCQLPLRIAPSSLSRSRPNPTKD